MVSYYWQAFSTHWRRLTHTHTRLSCLGLLATLCQNNPPVQKELLELGSLRILSDLFFAESSNDTDGPLLAKIIQAISANVRSHELAEAVFCQLDQAVPLLERGLGMNGTPAPIVVRRRTLFLMRALITSDSSTRERVRLLDRSICWMIDSLLGNEESAELREMVLDFVQELLRQQKSVNAVLSRKDHLAGMGVRRVTALRALTGEDREFGAVELELWENVIALLARATPDEEASSTAPLMAEVTMF